MIADGSGTGAALLPAAEPRSGADPPARIARRGAVFNSAGFELK